MAHPYPTESLFGQQLRHWRQRTGISQVELAAQAGSTPRYISFIETGRSRPGRDLVLRVAEALDIPLRERNNLLVAAGLPPVYPDHTLDDEALRPVKRVLAQVLQSHEPYPAWVVGPGFRFLSANRAAEAIFPGLCGLPAETIVDFWFGPGPFRQMVQNWQDVVWSGIGVLRREAARSQAPELLAILHRIEGLIKDVPRPEPGALPDFPVICPRFIVDGQVIRTIATVMRFDTAIELAVSELRVEQMFPADDESASYFLRQASKS